MLVHTFKGECSGRNIVLLIFNPLISLYVYYDHCEILCRKKCPSTLNCMALANVCSDKLHILLYQKHIDEETYTGVFSLVE